MPRFLLLASLFLAACGADGAPEPPSRGLAVTGEVQMGVVAR
ncbi:MAG: hypothetical protein ACK4IU_11485 [Tabrizicola flagellatus]